MLTPVKELANVIVDVTVVLALVTAMLRFPSADTVLNVSVNKSSVSEPVVPVTVNDVLTSAHSNIPEAPVAGHVNTCPAEPPVFGSV